MTGVQTCALPICSYSVFTTHCVAGLYRNDSYSVFTATQTLKVLAIQKLKRYTMTLLSKSTFAECSLRHTP